MLEKLEVPVDDVIEKFKKHIDLEHNRNILFSGKFGTGKSTFLRHFFEQNEEYYAVTLSPVNYVVSSNENIFELIKVDIIKQLFDHGHLKINEKKSISGAKAALEYVKKRPLNLVTYTLETISKLNPMLDILSTGAQGIQGLIKDFTEFEKALNSESSEENPKEYLENSAQIKGTYRESDLITLLIKNCIQGIQKRTVLVIDDIDRLDPEHIFRILNIFSSHDNHSGPEHKFGFEKVVLVSDYDNIHNLFKHRYGPEADFDGYMDKFYSIEIFRFSIRDSILLSIKNNLRMDLSIPATNVLAHFLIRFVENGVLKIRNLVKINNFSPNDSFRLREMEIDSNQFDVKYIHIIRSNVVYLESKDLEILSVVSILVSVFGQFEKLKSAIGKLTDNSSIENIRDFAHCFCLLELILRAKGNYRFLYFTPIRPEARNTHLRDFSPTFIPLQMFGFPIQIIPKWDDETPYSGSTSFFEGFSITARKVDQEITGVIGIEAMKSVINFIRQEKLEFKLGIVS